MTPNPHSGAFQDAAQLRAVLDSAVDGIVTIDERGIIEAANPAAEQLFGYTASEMVGRNVSMLMPSPVRQEHDSYLASYLRTGERHIIGKGQEVRGCRKDKTTFPLYLGVSETDFGGRRVFTGSLHDLTDLREAEQRATQFGRILETSLNEVFVFDAETFRFVMVNQGAVANVGYSAAEMQLMTPLDLKPELDLPSLRRMLQPLESSRDSVVEFETTHRRKDGSKYNAMIRVHNCDWAGRQAYVAFTIDVTDRTRRDTELRIRHRAIQAATEGIIIVDAIATDHPVIFVNPAFETLSGYPSDEAIGTPFLQLFGTIHNVPSVERLEDSLRDRTECRVTLECTHRHGEVVCSEVSVAPVPSSNGNVTHLVAVMEDVTARRLAQQQLLQSERLAAIGQMVTGLAHESRNALQRAEACLDMLSLDLQNHPEQLELTDKARRALMDLNRNYEEVRNYAAPIHLERHRCDIRQLWRSTWADLTTLRDRCRIELLESTGDIDLVCDVDEHRIRQVFRNIMENSIHACKETGLLTITTTDNAGPAGNCVKLCFRDDGPVLTARTIAGIFEPFFTTKQKGTGLGMAITQRIVEAHGGKIQADSSDDGGAIITIELPRTRPTMPEPKHPGSGDPALL